MIYRSPFNRFAPFKSFKPSTASLRSSRSDNGLSKSTPQWVEEALETQPAGAE
jgi:hypothetical protein